MAAIFKDGANLRHIFDSFGISLGSYNGKEQIVCKAKSGTHVHVHVYMRSHVAWHCPCKHYSEQVQLHMAVQLKPNLLHLQHQRHCVLHWHFVSCLQL